MRETANHCFCQGGLVGIWGESCTELGIASHAACMHAASARGLGGDEQGARER